MAVKTNTAPGYSGKPLAAKLGFKEGSRVLVVGDAVDYPRILAPVPAGVEFVARAATSVDLAHVFVTRRFELERHLKALRKQLRPDVVVWVSWPKQAAKVPTDVTENTVRDVALPLGFVDVKVCAVTDVWSGLKLVVRTALR